MNTITAPQPHNPITPGAHPAIVEDLVYFGLQTAFDPTKQPSEQYGIRFGIANGDGTTRSHWVTVNGTLDYRATLTKIVNATGIVFVAGQQIDLDTLVTRLLTVITENEMRDGKPRLKIAAYTTGTTSVATTAVRGDYPDWVRTKIANRLDKPAGPAPVNNGIPASWTATIPPGAADAVVTHR